MNVTSLELEVLDRFLAKETDVLRKGSQSDRW